MSQPIWQEYCADVRYVGKNKQSEKRRTAGGRLHSYFVRNCKTIILADKRAKKAQPDYNPKKKELGKVALQNYFEHVDFSLKDRLQMQRAYWEKNNMLH
jgi:hypothetical protein